MEEKRFTPQTPPRKTCSGSSARSVLLTSSSSTVVPGSPLPSTPTPAQPKRPVGRMVPPNSPLPPSSSRISKDTELSDSLQRSLSFKSYATAETTTHSITERSQTPEPLRIPHSPPVHHRELTPVTRNTRATIYVECNSAGIPVTPQEDDEYYNSSRQSLLFGEDLIMPNNLDLSDDEEDGICKPPLLAPGLPMANQGPLPPFQLQARKVFSFQAFDDDDDDDLYNASEDDDDDEEESFTPYAPSGRPAAFDMESVPSDVDIFQAVPDDVSLSRIPSLQRAELLMTTTMTDDAESLDGSFSSLGSSILPPARRYQDWQQQQHQQQLLQGTNEDTVDSLPEGLSESQRRRRKRRQLAREFLASVEGDESCVAEAASSKILLQRGSPLRRQVSCPQH